MELKYGKHYLWKYLTVYKLVKGVINRPYLQEGEAEFKKELQGGLVVITGILVTEQQLEVLYHEQEEYKNYSGTLERLNFCSQELKEELLAYVGAEGILKSGVYFIEGEPYKLVDSKYGPILQSYERCCIY